MDTSKWSFLGLGLTSYLVVILKDLPKRIWEYVSLYTSFSCSVTTRDNLAYQEVLKFIYELNSKVVKNHISIETTRDDKSDIIYSLDYGTFNIFPSLGTIIQIKKEENKEKLDLTNKITVHIFGKKQNYVNKLKDKLNSIITSNQLLIYPFKYTRDYKRIAKRYLNSIFIEKENFVKLAETLQNWKNKEIINIYKKVGIIHKLGILLYGIPGTGKTSLGKIIASELNYPLHIININAYNNEEELIDRITRISKNSIILFEDIDCYLDIIQNRKNEISDNINDTIPPSNEGKKEDKKPINLSVLLNIFDGILSPEDCIFIVTTNHIEKIDKALLREGRFDVKLEMKNISKETAYSMCIFYNIKTDILEDEIFPINPAYLQTKIFNNLIGIKE